MDSTTNALQDQLTPQARTVMQNMAYAAEKLGHQLYTPDHLLLGIMQTFECDAARLLTAVNIDSIDLRNKVLEHLKTATDLAPDVAAPAYSPDLDQLLADAATESAQRGHKQVDTLNLLAALRRAPNAIAASELNANGLTQQMVYSRLRFAKEQKQVVPKEQKALNELKAPDSIGEAIAKVIVSVSPLFLGISAAFLLSGYLLYSNIVANRMMVFFFVALGWLVSLALHEFGHAFVAYVGGDYTVEQKGYLTLDLRKYTHFALSIAMPLLFLLMGGIGLPGGAVYIQRNLIRKRYMHSLVSAAGPIANVLFTVLLAIPFFSFRFDVVVGGTRFFWAGMAFLIFLQITALALNLLPIPGLDGFGIIEPFLPYSVLTALAPLRRYGILLLIALLWFPNPFQDVFWSSVIWLGSLVLDPSWIWEGYNMFRFWEG